MTSPTALVAPFHTDLSAQVATGSTTFAVDSGTPLVEYREWGWGTWGQQGAWGQWLPLGLTLRSAESDAASIDPTGILDPATGAIAFRVTPIIETGLEELWGECGTKGSGTDHVQWGRDASTHPYVEWSANNAAYQRLTASETLAAGTECLFYTDWDGTIIRLSIDNGTIQTDTRDAVSDSWGAGDLVLKAA